MICPFRINVSFEYVKAPGIGDNGNDGYLEKEQKQTYPECYENECPYYSYDETCTRITEE